MLVWRAAELSLLSRWGLWGARSVSPQQREGTCPAVRRGTEGSEACLEEGSPKEGRPQETRCWRRTHSTHCKHNMINDVSTGYNNTVHSRAGDDELRQ